MNSCKHSKNKGERTISKEKEVIFLTVYLAWIRGLVSAEVGWAGVVHNIPMLLCDMQ
jgi:hypothetical protein